MGLVDEDPPVLDPLHQLSVTHRRATGDQQPLRVQEPPDEEHRMDWRHHALCRDEDPELFFPIGTTGPAAMQVQEAKTVCARCSVASACLEWALESGQDSGVWGGTSEDERRALKRASLRAVRSA